MLANTRITTTLPVVNMERARRFYMDGLGLGAGEAAPDGGLLFRTAAGSELELVPRQEPTHADHTAASFEVEDIEAEVRDLEARGVHFEDYALPQLHTEGHIAEVGGDRAAWFKDPEGNILCVHQRLI
jgi:extradiol dioxygenase family protein